MPYLPFLIAFWLPFQAPLPAALPCAALQGTCASELAEPIA
jgi:hypothetical protein